MAGGFMMMRKAVTIVLFIVFGQCGRHKKRPIGGFMTSGTVSKKIRQYNRRQMKKLYPLLYAEVKRQFFDLIPRLPLKKRLNLIWKILRAKPIRKEKESDGG
jgi:hypothetical protein